MRILQLIAGFFGMGLISIGVHIHMFSEWGLLPLAIGGGMIGWATQ